MGESEEKNNIIFWRKRTMIGITTVLIVLLSSLIFYFTSLSSYFFLDILLEMVALIPLLLVSSYLIFNLDVKYRKVKAGYGMYVRNSLSYLYIIVPFWVMSAADILSFGRPYLTLIYMNVILSAAIVGIAINIRVRVWKRISKDMSSINVVNVANDIAGRMGVKISGYRVVDWSRARIANAFQAGITHYYIFVTNFLMENLSEEEEVAIMAHEIAHAKMKHLKKTLVSVGFCTFVIGNALFYLVVYFLNYGLRIGMLFGLIISIFVTSYLLLPVLRRRYEKEADLVAARCTSPKLLADSLLKLSKLNHTPISVPRYWNLSHPSTSDRVGYLMEMQRKINDLQPSGTVDS
ncbi:MAG: M48 family metallopeptidase [Thermoplasmata archaeon]